jgi:GDPmannose 4,6-dehydratase
MVCAVVTGITGQDGAYPTELLLNKCYIGYGTFRRTSSVNLWRVDEISVGQRPNFFAIDYSS